MDNNEGGLWTGSWQQHHCNSQKSIDREARAVRPMISSAAVETRERRRRGEQENRKKESWRHCCETFKDNERSRLTERLKNLDYGEAQKLGGVGLESCTGFSFWIWNSIRSIADATEVHRAAYSPPASPLYSYFCFVFRVCTSVS